MSYRTHVPVLLGLMAAIVLVASALALAGTASGNYSYFTCGNYGYKNRAYVETGSSGAKAYTFVYSDPQANRPAGWFGTLPRLYSSSGALKAQGSYTYSGSSTYALGTGTTNYNVRGSYYSYGVSKSWTGTDYHSHATYTSPCQTY